MAAGALAAGMLAGAILTTFSIARPPDDLIVLTASSEPVWTATERIAFSDAAFLDVLPVNLTGQVTLAPAVVEVSSEASVESGPEDAVEASTPVEAALEEGESLASVVPPLEEFAEDDGSAESALSFKTEARTPTVGLTWPLVAPLTSIFGPAHPLGIDFAANQGTPVRAAGDGRVRAAAYNEIYGYFAILDHPGGYTTVYAHFAVPAAVRAGETVWRGDTIGVVGNTGKSFGPHLHFEVHRYNRLIDPLSALPRIPLVISSQAYRAPASAAPPPTATPAPPSPTSVAAATPSPSSQPHPSPARPTQALEPLAATPITTPSAAPTSTQSTPPATAAIASVTPAAILPPRAAVSPAPVVTPPPTVQPTPRPTPPAAAATPPPPSRTPSPSPPRPTPTRAGGAEAPEP